MNVSVESNTGQNKHNHVKKNVRVESISSFQLILSNNFIITSINYPSNIQFIPDIKN